MTPNATNRPATGFRYEWHCRLSGLKLRHVAGEQFGSGLIARLPQ